MPTPFDQLLKDLQAAQGDPSALALVTFDFAVASDPLLKEAAIAAAIPHWFDEKTLPALLPEHADQADCLLELVKTLPMVEPYERGTGQPAWNIHEATRLALRQCLWQSEPERFKTLSRRAASAYGSADDTAPDFALTCEHLYHQLAGQTDAGDEAMEQVAGAWRGEFRTERLQTLARLVEELVALTPAHPPLLLRGRGLCHQFIAVARVNHQPAPLTVARLQQAEQCFRTLAASDPTNAMWQRDLAVSINNLGNLAVKQGDLAGALRYFTESKTLRECLATSDPANAELQRDLSVSLEKLGDLAVAQGDLAGALRYFTECKSTAGRLAASNPTNAMWQRDLSVSLEKLGDLAVAQGDLAEALRYFTECKSIRERLAGSDPANAELQRDLWISDGKLGDLATDQGDVPAALGYWTRANDITSRLAASDPANAEWQRDLSVSLEKLGNLAVAQGDLAGALRSFTESKDIRERLAGSDPANAAWQRDLSVSLNKLGNLAVKQGDLAGALRYFTESKTIAERLATNDPANAEWQRDLSYSFWLIAAKVFQPQERWAEALELMEQSLPIDERLATTDPTNVTWQKDVTVSRALVEKLRAKVGGK